MKYLNAILLLCFLSALGETAAQESDAPVQVTSKADSFTVSMPHQPNQQHIATLKTNSGDLPVEGQLYETATSSTSYRVWALIYPDQNPAQRASADKYLDSCAELTWEGLLKPERDALPDDRKRFASMTYVKELSAKEIPGREYTLTIDNLTGTAQFFVTKARAYVLVAMGPVGGSWTREPFFMSFAVDPAVPLLPPTSGAISGPNDLTDTQQVFKSNQVTQRARVLEKPEPSYTESARIFSITGTVVLRAVFSSDGHVTNIVIIRKLPHGLTEKAVKAAQAIRFTPAMKDGQPVSMWMQLEYNFNLY